MDPNETLRLLANAVNSEEWAEAHEALNNLRNWRSRNGFKPSAYLELVRTDLPTRKFCSSGGTILGEHTITCAKPFDHPGDHGRQGFYWSRG